MLKDRLKKYSQKVFPLLVLLPVTISPKISHRCIAQQSVCLVAAAVSAAQESKAACLLMLRTTCLSAA